MALELAPKDAGALANRGRDLLQDLERYDEALVDFSRALELDPKDASAAGQSGQDPTVC